ncbi:hypothetical protein FB45DRAFT_1014199 [Roridomyces roridus]|uniref:Uncharacterized protein n=1 Tax=Roridomyces roridus TaxID=1738132 RepID=A0AAD7AY85_9AGAR|nr:hypothetical protein FB45DRAFT_1014199 [Roridomyces roridus]
MAAEPSPLYKTIAEQVAAYIDIAVTEPMPGWSPPWGSLPFEVLHDYDMDFPLPPGLAAILAIPEMSDDHRITFQQVVLDVLNVPDSVRYWIHNYAELVQGLEESGTTSRSFVSHIAADPTPRF